MLKHRYLDIRIPEQQNIKTAYFIGSCSYLLEHEVEYMFFLETVKLLFVKL